MKNHRTPYTEPYTPEEAAELASAMKETTERMNANGAHDLAEHLACFWTEPEEKPSTNAGQPVERACQVTQ